ncbi:uncharacterized protein ACNLHF_012153 isoform 2-T2 [Anomaloglossus baeobatrachus]
MVRTESNLTDKDTISESDTQRETNHEDGDVQDNMHEVENEASSGPIVAGSQENNDFNPNDVTNEKDDDFETSNQNSALDISTHHAPTYTRGRRRKGKNVTNTRREVDNGVLDYLSRTINDDGEEAFSRSLAQYLRQIPRGVRLRERSCMQTIIDACTPPNTPHLIFNYIERWQLSEENKLDNTPPNIDAITSNTLPQPPHIPSVCVSNRDNMSGYEHTNEITHNLHMNIGDNAHNVVRQTYNPNINSNIHYSNQREQHYDHTHASSNAREISLRNFPEPAYSHHTPSSYTSKDNNLVQPISTRPEQHQDHKMQTPASQMQRSTNVTPRYMNL